MEGKDIYSATPLFTSEVYREYLGHGGADDNIFDYSNEFIRNEAAIMGTSICDPFPEIIGTHLWENLEPRTYLDTNPRDFTRFSNMFENSRIDAPFSPIVSPNLWRSSPKSPDIFTSLEDDEYFHVNVPFEADESIDIFSGYQFPSRAASPDIFDGNRTEIEEIFNPFCYNIHLNVQVNNDRSTGNNDFAGTQNFSNPDSPDMFEVTSNGSLDITFCESVEIFDLEIEESLRDQNEAACEPRSPDLFRLMDTTALNNITFEEREDQMDLIRVEMQHQVNDEHSQRLYSTQLSMRSPDIFEKTLQDEEERNENLEEQISNRITSRSPDLFEITHQLDITVYHDASPVHNATHMTEAEELNLAMDFTRAVLLSPTAGASPKPSMEYDEEICRQIYENIVGAKAGASTKENAAVANRGTTTEPLIQETVEQSHGAVDLDETRMSNAT